MRDRLNRIRLEAEKKLSEAKTAAELEGLRLQYLGKKGELTAVLRGMGSLSPEERPVIGQLANDVRSFIEEKLEEASENLQKREQEIRLGKETIDVTIPGRRRMIGNKHPLSIVMDEIKDVFTSMGYEIAEGPEVELDYNHMPWKSLPFRRSGRDAFPHLPPGGGPGGGQGSYYGRSGGNTSIVCPEPVRGKDGNQAEASPFPVYRAQR